MDKKTIPFLDLFVKYCEHSFDKEKTIKVFHYFLEKSALIVTAIKFNEILDEDHFMEARGILKEMEVDIFKNNISIYYVEYPYDNNVLNRISFKDFLNNLYDFFAEKGQPSRGNLQSIRLEFEIKILYLLVAKSQPTDLNHSRYRQNNHNQQQDELYLLIKNSEEKILEKYGKSYKDLTRDEFRECVEAVFNREDSQHLVDHLWYRIRND